MKKIKAGITLVEVAGIIAIMLLLVSIASKTKGLSPSQHIASEILNGMTWQTKGCGD